MLWIALHGCTFSTFEYTPCAAPADCRDAFGFGSTCGDDGYCRSLAELNRCENTYPPDLLTNVADYHDRIVFASVYDSAFARLEEQASELAFRGVNGQGGFDGQEFALIECDYNADGTTTYDNDDEATVVGNIGNWLVDAGVPALVGPSTSSSTQAMYESTGNSGILMVSPSASSPALALIDGIAHSDDQPGMLWRTVPSDSAQANAIAYDLGDRDVGRVSVIAVTGAYGEGIANAFIDTYSDGVRVIDIHTFDDSDTALLGEHIASTANGSYDEVLYVGSSVTSVAQFLNGAATHQEFADGTIQIFLTEAARYEQLFDETTGATVLYPHIRGTSPASPSGAVYESFRGAFASEFGGDSADDSIYTSYAFDAAWLLIYGTAWSQYQEGAITGFGMAKGLRQVSDGAAVPIQSTNWTTVKANFEVGQAIDLEGASGQLDFDPETEETSSAVDIWTIVTEGPPTFENQDQFGPDL